MELKIMGDSEIYKSNFIDCDINKRETDIKLFLMLSFKFI